MNVEKQARRELRRMVFYRILGEVFTLPQYVLRGIIGLLQAIGAWFHTIELAIFMLEQDAARKYTLITSVDLGTSGGDPGRYAALDPIRNQEIQQMGYEKWRLSQGD